VFRSSTSSPTSTCECVLWLSADETWLYLTKPPPLTENAANNRNSCSGGGRGSGSGGGGCNSLFGGDVCARVCVKEVERVEVMKRDKQGDDLVTHTHTQREREREREKRDCANRSPHRIFFKMCVYVRDMGVSVRVLCLPRVCVLSALPLLLLSLFF